MGSERASGAATLEEVARAAGVSLATASRALNGSTRKVNPEYRERVLAAARITPDAMLAKYGSEMSATTSATVDVPPLATAWAARLGE